MGPRSVVLGYEAIEAKLKNMLCGVQSVQGISRNDFQTSLGKDDFFESFIFLRLLRSRSGPDPAERFSVSLKNHVLQVL